MHDVLVVGAGPAGAIAATVLARAGARVCLIDRATFPRPKLCGDTINPGALDILRRLQLADPIERRGMPIAGMLVTGDGVAVAGRYPQGIHGLAITRHDLDLMLVEQAASAGAEVRDGVAVRGPIVDGEDGAQQRVSGVHCLSAGGAPFQMRAHVTIAADGRRSTLAFALGLARHPASPRRWAIGMYAANVSGCSNLGEMHIREGYYLGIAPVPGGLTNVCVVRPSYPGDPALRDPAALVRSALESEPGLRERFVAATFAGRPVVVGPLAVEATPALSPRGLLVAGDAAGFIDPMTGDGLRFAFRGGELAAGAALRSLESGWDEATAWFDRERRHDFAAKWRFNRTLRALVASPLALRGARLGARLAPPIVRAVIRRASDCHLAGAG